MRFAPGASPRWMHVPVDPNAPDAQKLLLRELSKPEYRSSQPTWFDRLATAVGDWLAGLRLGQGPNGNLGLIVIVVLVAVGIVVLFLVFGVPRLNRRSAVTGALFGVDDSRSASDILAAARRAAAASDHTLAIIEGFRSIARGLAERELLTTSPGTTAHDFATQAGSIFPIHAAAITDAAASFDRVRYLGGDGNAREWEGIESLARELAVARPALELADA